MKKLIIGSPIVQRTKRAAVAKACAKYNATARELASNARINLVIVGQMQLTEVHRTKVSKLAEKKTVYKQSKESKELRFQYWAQHLLVRLFSKGEWIPTWILEKMSSPLQFLKSLRKKFFKDTKKSFSLGWTIGECFNGVKDFMAQLSNYNLVLG